MCSVLFTGSMDISTPIHGLERNVNANPIYGGKWNACIVSRGIVFVINRVVIFKNRDWIKHSRLANQSPYSNILWCWIIEPSQFEYSHINHIRLSNKT